MTGTWPDELHAAEHSDRDRRLARMKRSLVGLALGDAFGQTFFGFPKQVEEAIALRILRPAPWRYTDDTEMALSVAAALTQHGTIDQDALARSFAKHYSAMRGYGPSMHGVLARIGAGQPWRAVVRAQFGGQGSYGNGAAMRVAPLGAYFADDLAAVSEHAARSAEVTHAHADAIAGAIAVAIAAALASRLAMHGNRPAPEQFLAAVHAQVPPGLVSERLRHAQQLAPGSSVHLAVAALGNGTGMSAQDTVPFALWCAAQSLDHLEEALWLTVSGLGDRDTTCAIVGGIVACSDAGAPPEAWLDRCEPLPFWQSWDDAAPR